MIQMPGCELHGSGVVIPVPMSITGSTHSIPMSLPTNPSLEGANLVYQSFTFSPPLTPLGFISSNGLLLFLASQ